MTAPHYVDCPNCGEKHDTSGQYTSPANRELDRRLWAEEHLSGRCVSASAARENENATSTPEQRFNALKDRLIAAAGSPGLTSFHDGRVHMTLGEWEQLIELVAVANASPVTEKHTRDRISAALNRAADKVCALAPQDERLGDAINLVVNAGLHLLKFPDADLEAVVEANYSEDVDTVLGWVRDGQ
ncbi:hypothetical protein [Promicromonospora aerolata]|uniref:Uncharacterized protein n=1 Tax=Promicromonospora aerolata TaxID=195749 RepID=A0ABW4V2T5_9MICO